MPEAAAAAGGRRGPGARGQHGPARVLRALPARVHQTAADPRRQRQRRHRRGLHAVALVHEPRIFGVSKVENTHVNRSENSRQH